MPDLSKTTNRESRHDPVLRITDMVARYGRIQVLHGVSLEVGAGKLVSLIGSNGAGKTTLLRLISGLLPCAGGKLEAFGTDMTSAGSSERVKAGICQVPEGRQVFGPLSVEDNLRLGGYLQSRADQNTGVEQVFGLFPILKEKRREAAMTLSGGQQQMLAIGRALMAKPRLLLLDEPSMGLSPKLVGEVFSTIERLRADGMSILLIEQNAELALSIADFGYVLDTGKIAMSGTSAEILNDDVVQRVYLGL